MTPSIRNCTFAFKCSKTWDTLTPASNPRVKYCEDCERDVHFCDTDHELAEAIALSRCVVIVAENHIGIGMALTGMPIFRDRNGIVDSISE